MPVKAKYWIAYWARTRVGQRRSCARWHVTASIQKEFPQSVRANGYRTLAAILRVHSTGMANKKQQRQTAKRICFRRQKSLGANMPERSGSSEHLHTNMRERRAGHAG